MVAEMKALNWSVRSWDGWVLTFSLVVLVLSLVHCSVAPVVTLEELSVGLFDSVSHNVTHVAVDEETGRVYVGAVNRLYELSPQLDQPPLRQVRVSVLPKRPSTPTMCPSNKLPVASICCFRLAASTSCWC